MVDRFNQVAADENLEKRAAAAGRSPHDVLVVASIIERETSDHKYAPLVAEVIYNRLAQGMRLQSDATVAYANNLEGKVTTTDEGGGTSSPYNTYMVDGPRRRRSPIPARLPSMRRWRRRAATISTSSR